MLDKYNKDKTPFKVPENYFEGLTKDIMNNLPQKEAVQVKKVALWKKVLPWTAVAAVVATVVITLGTLGDVPNLISEGAGGEKMETVEKPKFAFNEEEDYFLFLEDEVNEAMYDELLMDQQ